MEDRIKQSKFLNKVIIIVSVLVFFTFLIYYGNQVLILYRHPTDHFSIKFPPKWSRMQNKDGASIIFISPKEGSLDSYNENVNVLVQDLSKNPMSLQKYTDTAIFQVKVVFKSSIKVLESKGIYLDGKPGYKFVYSTIGDPEVTIMHIWTVVGLKAYQVTFTTRAAEFNEYTELFEKMIKSFRIR